MSRIYGAKDEVERDKLDRELGWRQTMKEGLVNFSEYILTVNTYCEDI